MFTSNAALQPHAYQILNRTAHIKNLNFYLNVLCNCHFFKYERSVLCKKEILHLNTEVLLILLSLSVFQFFLFFL